MNKTTELQALMASTDDLRKRAWELEKAWYLQGKFNPAEWDALIAEFETAGRISGAAALRTKRDAIADAKESGV